MNTLNIESTRKIRKSLYYKRAAFQSEQTELSLEDCVKQVLQALPLVKQRGYEYEGVVYYLSISDEKEGVGTFIYITSHIPDGTVLGVAKNVEEETLEPLLMSPQDGSEYLEYDAAALIVGNHVFLCASQIRAKITYLLMNLMKNAGVPTDARFFELVTIANIDILHAISSIGVKSFTFDASLYEASFDYADRKTVTQTVVSKVKRAVLSIVGEDEDTHRLHNLSDIHASIELKIDGKVSPSTQHLINEVAGKTSEEGDSKSEVKIVLKNNHVIRGKDISLTRSVDMLAYGNSIRHLDAWKKLEDYYVELKNSGVLEQ